MNYTNRPLDHEYLCRILDYNPNTGLFTRKISTGGRAVEGDIAGGTTNGYIQIFIEGKFYKAHRLAWFYIYKTWPPDQIDHINRIKNDNRLVNLRLSTQALNNKNTSLRKTSQSKIIGVTHDSKNNCWRARISVNKKQIFLGNFLTKSGAETARRNAEEQYGFSNE